MRLSRDTSDKCRQLGFVESTMKRIKIKIRTSIIIVKNLFRIYSKMPHLRHTYIYRHLLIKQQLLLSKNIRGKEGGLRSPTLDARGRGGGGAPGAEATILRGPCPGLIPGFIYF